MRRRETMQTYVVNEFISLRLENGLSQIYVMGELFKHCKYLLISLPAEEFDEFEGYDSMDEIIKATNKRGGGEQSAKGLTPEEAFRGHCSNLQAWVENDYNYKILDTNLSIPIINSVLKGIVKERDKEKFRNFFMSVVKSLDEYVTSSLSNEYTYGKFTYLSNIVFRTRDRYFTDEEISGSIVLSEIYKRCKADSDMRKLKVKFGRVEAKLWGTGPVNLRHRRHLRTIRNFDSELKTTQKNILSSPEIDYLPYLYAKGKFQKTGKISLCYIDDGSLIIRDEQGIYWYAYNSDNYY